jgi:hypothetical protein
MTSYLYRPGHPMASERGFVESSDFYAHKFFTEPDLRMMRGNEPVTLNFISDEIAPTRHMVSGKHFTSKHKFRQETKRLGCIEIGNELDTVTKLKKYVPPTSKKQLVQDIKNAAKQLTEKTIPEGEMAKIKKTAEIMKYHERNRKKK